MRAMEPLPAAIAEKLGDVRALCEKCRVKRLEIFGSAVKGTFDAATSDVDFVVEFLPFDDVMARGQAYLDLWFGLQDLFGRQVDLISRITNPYFAEAIEADRREIYDAA